MKEIVEIYAILLIKIVDGCKTLLRAFCSIVDGIEIGLHFALGLADSLLHALDTLVKTLHVNSGILYFACGIYEVSNKDSKRIGDKSDDVGFLRSVESLPCSIKTLRFEHCNGKRHRRAINGLFQSYPCAYGSLDTKKNN